MSNANDWLVFDTNPVRYLMDAMDAATDRSWPTATDVDQQRRDAVRVFLYGQTAVGPTQRAELARNPDLAQGAAALGHVDVLFQELIPTEEQQAQIEARTSELLVHHNDADDCRVLAEAEAFDEVRFLVTNDRRFRNRLQRHTRTEMITPSDMWVRLAIPPGTPPRWTPAPSNPLAGAAWWRS